jgi:mono/diheme cytochrome c family protein
MKKIVMSVLALTVLGLGSANAAVYKGQKVYIQKCKKCHGGGLEVAASKKRSGWKKLMKNKGEELAKLHLNNEKAKESWDYFESSTYTKKAKDLKDFLVEYAKDSGNVPACN